MALDRDHALAAIGTLINGTQVYSAFLPSVFTIRHFGVDPDTIKDIRDGEKIATGFVLSIGIIVSLLVNSAMPLYTSVFLAIIMISVYEYALATKHETKEEPEEVAI